VKKNVKKFLLENANMLKQEKMKKIQIVEEENVVI